LQICTVETLNFIFRLGVVFAIFGFLWFLIHLGISLLRGGGKKTIPEAYILKFIRYFFLVDVTVLFALDINEGFLAIDKAVMAGLILLVYFLGKLQNAQLRTQMFKVQGLGGANFLSQFKPVFHYKSELLVISLSVIIFALLLIFPDYAANPISTWFYESIIDIEDTPVFGFIFKVIGFFFVLSIFMKLASAFTTLLSGRPNERGEDNDEGEDDHFDDYTEVK
jgi:hypothetical protein